MPARRKIPLVWKSAKQSDQTLFKYNSISGRTVQVGCGCTTATPPPPCTPPDPVTSVTLSNLTSTGGDISFVYGGTETTFVAGVYTSSTLPVNTGGTPVQTFIGSLPPAGQTYVFPTVANNYYVIGLRVRKDCGGGVYEYSTYVYSEPVQYVPVVLFQYTRVGGGLGNPGTGNFSIVLISLPNVVVQFNVTDTNSQDATTWLSTEIATCNSIIIEKDLSNYVVVTRNVNNNFGTFWAFNSTITSSLGIVNNGDTVTVTYS